MCDYLGELAQLGITKSKEHNRGKRRREVQRASAGAVCFGGPKRISDVVRVRVNRVSVVGWW
nr:hypothetical protein [Halorubrum sp. CGM4_25_10-8A]